VGSLSASQQLAGADAASARYRERSRDAAPLSSQPLAGLVSDLLNEKFWGELCVVLKIP
jgi:hypothetical protein